MNRFVYVDHAATTPLDQEAYEAMRPFLMNDYANASQNYSFAKKSRRALNEARSTIASCIGAEFEEIVFTSGGSESNNWAIKGRASSWREKREIITTTIEHHSILRACQAVQKSGYSIKYLQTDKDGIVEKEKLLSSITQHTDLVSIMMANNEIGTLQNLSPLVSIAHTNGALFHTDAVQAIGHVKIDVKQIGVDLLSASAHKFNGPKGIGFLYIRKGTEIDPLISGGKQEFGWRAGTENVASIVGMACALKKNTEQLEQNIGQIP